MIKKPTIGRHINRLSRAPTTGAYVPKGASRGYSDKLVQRRATMVIETFSGEPLPSLDASYQITYATAIEAMAISMASRSKRKRTMRIITEKHLVEAQAEVAKAEAKQLELFKPKVMSRIVNRFRDEEAAEEWFNNGRISGYGALSPRDLVKQGRAAWVIEAIDAINAGVFA